MIRLSSCLILATLLVAGPVHAQVGVLGDSNSDEYRADDNRGFGEWKPHTLNWVELLVKHRGLDFGDWGTRSAPRRTGYAYNWARSGARAASMVNSGQHTGLAEQVGAGDVQFAVIYIGINDWKPGSGHYDEIYNGQLSGSGLLNTINEFVGNVATAVDVAQEAGNVEIIVASVNDPGLNPAMITQFPNASKRATVSSAIESVNNGLIQLAQSRAGVEFLDQDELVLKLLDRVTPQGFINLAGHMVDIFRSGEGPLHFRLADESGHPSTIGSGFIANVFIEGFNQHWGLNIEPFSDQELIDIAFGNVSVDDEAPSVPGNLNAVPASPTRINLSWNGSTDNVGIAGYRVYRGGNQIATSTSTSYADQTVVAGTQYEYRVAAYDAAGNVSALSSPASATTPSENTAPLAQDDDVQVEAGEEANVVLEATDPDGDALTFSVQDSPSHGSLSGSPPALTYEPNAGFVGEDSFTFRASDGESQSNVATIRLNVSDSKPPTVPGDVEVAAITPYRIDVSWDASTDAVGVEQYVVYRDGEQVATTEDLLFVDQGLTPNTTYAYRISAKDAGGNESAKSGAVQATTPDEDLPVQVLSLRQGWNMISTRMLPRSADIETLFEPIVDELFLVKDIQGRTYIPSQEINSIGTWDLDQAYMAYVFSNTSLEIEGDPVEPENTPIELNQGWNLVPYLRDSAQSIDQALSTIEDELIVVKDYAGKIHYPQYGIDQIQSMQPGQGYQLYVRESSTLLYAANEGPGATKSALVHQEEGIPASAILLLRGNNLQDGDQVVVRSNDEMIVGMSVVHDGVAAITIRGDEVLTPDHQEGARVGDVLEVAVTDGVVRRVELGAVMDALRDEPVSSPLKYRHNAVWVADVTSVGSEDEPTLPTTHTLSQNYPNPFNPETVIDYSLASTGPVRVSVYNATGQLIAVLVDGEESAGHHSVTFRGTGLSTGLYFYRLETEAGAITRSMLFLK